MPLMEKGMKTVKVGIRTCNLYLAADWNSGAGVMQISVMIPDYSLFVPNFALQRYGFPDYSS
jgi:hypothetical protein